MIVVAMLFTMPSFSQDASVEATISPIEILIGEQAKVKVKATMKEGSDAVFPVFKASQEITPGVEVLESKEEGVHGTENGFVERTVTYTITSFDDTLYYLPPFEVKIGGKVYFDEVSCHEKGNDKNLVLNGCFNSDDLSKWEVIGYAGQTMKIM